MGESVEFAADVSRGDGVAAGETDDEGDGAVRGVAEYVDTLSSFSLSLSLSLTNAKRLSLSLSASLSQTMRALSLSL